MDKINYFDIIKKAASLTWKNKNLWWFGLLASFTSAGSSFNSSFNGNADTKGLAGQQIMAFISNHTGLIILAAIFCLILCLVFCILGIIGRGALIKSINKILEPEYSGEKTSFKEGFREGKKYFWKLLGIGVITSLFILASLLILATPIIFLFLNHAYIFGALLILIAIAILIPLVILSVYLRIYGYLYSVLGELKIWAAIENAYALFRRNLGVSIILGLIFILIGIIYGLSILLLFIPIVAIFFVLGSFLYLMLKGVGMAIVIALGALVAIAITLFLKSIYETFAQTVWILFFHEIAKPKVEEVVAEEVKELKSIPTPDPVKSSEIL